MTAQQSARLRYYERMNEGRAISQELSPHRSKEAVGKILGLPVQRVDEAECIALYKVKRRLIQLTGTV